MVFETGRTPTVDLSREPDDVCCVGLGFCEYALEEPRRRLSERAGVDCGRAWRRARARGEEGGSALERAAERVRTDMRFLTLAPLHEFPLTTRSRSRPHSAPFAVSSHIHWIASIHTLSDNLWSISHSIIHELHPLCFDYLHTSVQVVTSLNELRRQFYRNSILDTQIIIVPANKGFSATDIQLRCVCYTSF